MRVLPVALALTLAMMQTVSAQEFYRAPLSSPVIFSMPAVEQMKIELQELQDPIEGNVNESFSFDLSNLASISGGKDDLEVGDLIWSSDSIFPDGLSIDGKGLVSGLPRKVQELPIEVVATDGTVDGRRIYTIKINGFVLDATKIASSFHHSCILKTDGKVMCWGNGASGQLGDGESRESHTPVEVQGLTNAVDITAGGDHTCALTAERAVLCWGNDTNGQLGNDTALQNSSTPVQVSGLTSGVKAVHAGYSHTCAIDSVGAVKCWGRNSFAELGTTAAGSTRSAIPVQATRMTSNAVALSAGASHTCVLMTDTSVRCWGYNQFGQVGNGAWGDVRVDTERTAVQSGVVAISGGIMNNCAIKSDETVLCWGNNEKGQIGNGLKTNAGSPIAISGLTQVKQVSVGRDHVCAIVGTSRTVKCWGANTGGILGTAGTVDVTRPADVSGLSDVDMLATGYNFSCALDDESVKCWGLDSNGKLGNGSAGSSLIPMPVAF